MRPERWRTQEHGLCHGAGEDLDNPTRQPLRLGGLEREDRALLIVTHDPKVRTIADRVVRIRDGRIEV